MAWYPLGWRAAWLAEIEPFPSAVLAHHYPNVPNLGDMTTLVRRVLNREIEAPDVFTGGTPCQAFSVAGTRMSLDDARGNLTLTFVEIANAIDHVRVADGRDPAVVMWENVPGVLSTRDNAFGCFLGALAGSGCALLPPDFDPDGGKPPAWSNAGCVYGPQRAVAWRVLDAQYFGVAQRRRRVFVVASARNGFDPAAVLFESDGVRRDSAPRREAREGTAGHAEKDVGSRGVRWPAEIACTLNAAFGDKQGIEDQHALSGAPLFVPAVPLCASGQANAEILADIAPTLTADNDIRYIMTPPVVGTLTARSVTSLGAPEVDGGMFLPMTLGAITASMGVGSPLGHNKDDKIVSGSANAIRRITPRECERLQGFPDDYTAIPWRGKPADACPDGPRYKALGNSWAVPCAGWIGERIASHLNRIEEPTR